jgi:hypothetical protein
MTNHEERMALLKAAQELHNMLQSIAPQVRRTVNMLIGAADELSLVAADEVSAGESVTKRVVTYRGKERDTTTLDVPDPAEVARVAAHPMSGYVDGGWSGPKKRACSLCHQTGHWAKNCPNAHTIQDAKKAEVAARPVKRARAPLSPERKAQLIATLAKARAAKKGGKK